MDARMGQPRGHRVERNPARTALPCACAAQARSLPGQGGRSPPGGPGRDRPGLLVTGGGETGGRALQDALGTSVRVWVPRLRKALAERLRGLACNDRLRLRARLGCEAVVFADLVRQQPLQTTAGTALRKVSGAGERGRGRQHSIICAELASRRRAWKEESPEANWNSRLWLRTNFSTSESSCSTAAGHRAGVGCARRRALH